MEKNREADYISEHDWEVFDKIKSIKDINRYSAMKKEFNIISNIDVDKYCSYTNIFFKIKKFFKNIFTNK
jgi:hemerythrin superfamily protein